MRWLVMIALVACGGGDDGGGTDKNRDADPTADTPAADAPPATPDAAFGPGALCGATTCPTTQVCCTGATLSCKAAADCPTQHFACDGPEDCGAGTCCFGSGGQGGSECRAAGQNCNDVACHADSDCGGSTPKCCPKAFTPSYNVCLAACP
jgi:hypothetical protein